VAPQHWTLGSHVLKSRARSSAVPTVRSAYQSPASNTFLTEQISHQQAVLFSQNKSTPAISHQPNEQAGLVHESGQAVASCEEKTACAHPVCTLRLLHITFDHLSYLKICENVLIIMIYLKYI
jgi:hypothetical protein